MTKREIEIQALLLRHQANGCMSALLDWRDSTNYATRAAAITALEAAFQVLEARAKGLEELVAQWDEFGPYFGEAGHAD